MNIKILKNSQGFDGIILNHRKVLEIRSQKSQYNGINLVKYYLFDLETNEKEEVLPKIKKYNVVLIEDSIWESEFLIFSAIIPLEKNKVQIQIIKFYYMTEEFENIFSFTEDINRFPKDIRVRVFPVNENYFVIQTEKHHDDFSVNYALQLVNSKENISVEIVDQNLINNGIDSIIPVSETHSVIKTGRSIFNDNLFEHLNDESAPVESISVINIQQLISDIMLTGDNLIQETLNQTHLTSTFSPVMAREDFVVYSIINLQTKEEEIFFYNFNTKETINCRNQNVENIDSLAKTYVIDNTPYVKLLTERGTEFYNIIRGKVDIMFEQGVEVKEYVNNIFIVSRIIKKTMRKVKTVLSIYKYPGLTLLHEEKAEFTGCVNVDKENIHVFVK